MSRRRFRTSGSQFDAYFSEYFQFNIYDEYIYNAITLAYGVIYNVVDKKVSLDDGVAVVDAAINGNFPSLHGNATVNAAGALQMYFSLWDFNPDTGRFRLTMEAANGGTTAGLFPVLWPTGHQPSPDNCASSLCSSGMTSTVILRINLQYIYIYIYI